MIRFRNIPFLICCIGVASLAVVILGGWLTDSNVTLNLAKTLGMLSEDNLEEYIQATVTVGNLILVVEYFLLGLFVCCLVAMLCKEALEVFLVSASCSFTFACVNEVLHVILPGCVGSFSNLLWGAIGIVIGSGILTLIFRFCLKANRKPVHMPKHAEKKSNPKRREMPKFKDMD